MPLHPELTDICWRILLTVVAGLLVGMNRTEHGKAAGVRTVMLVCLAASFAMILANVLMDTTGKPPTSFVQLDMMRLPLGVLTGMGFIGGGTILRRGNLIVGVTTAATLWYVTMLGFCFGAGQFLIGGIALVLGLAILWGVRRAEDHVKLERRATVMLTMQGDAPTEPELRNMLLEGKYSIESWSVAYSQVGVHRRIRCVVKWYGLPTETAVPGFVEALRRMPGVEKLRWVPAVAGR